MLDLYAGSGAVGLEALSRGAAHALLVEADPRAARTVARQRRDPRAAPAPRCGGAGSSGSPPHGLPGPAYDVVFADPPYDLTDDELRTVLADLRPARWPTPRSWWSSGPPAAAHWTWPAGFEELRSRRYGEATLWYGRADRSRLAARPASQLSRRAPRDRPPLRVPGLVRPGHQRPPGRAGQGQPAVRRGHRRGAREPGQVRACSRSPERIEMLREVTAELGNVRVDSFEGLLVDYCRERGIPVVVKGLRAVSDFDYELQMAQMNHRLTGLETFFVADQPGVLVPLV